MVLKNATRIVLIQIILTVIVSVFLTIYAPQRLIELPYALLLGSIVSLVNFVGLLIIFILSRQKKRVALGILIVVIKYAFLGIILWYALVYSNLPRGAFVTGLTLNPVALIIFALVFSKRLSQS